MSTVTELLDIIEQDVPLSSSERTIALARLQWAYRYAVNFIGGTPYEVSLSPADDLTYLDLSDGSTYDTTLANRFLRLEGIRVSNSEGSNELVGDSLRTIRAEAAKTSATGRPNTYAFAWPYLYLDRPTSSLTIAIDARLSAPTLAEASGTGVETTPSALLPAYHEDVLASLAKAIILEGYDGRLSEAQSQRNLAMEALVAMKDQQANVTGQRGRAYARSRFSSPTPLEAR